MSNRLHDILIKNSTKYGNNFVFTYRVSDKYLRITYKELYSYINN